MISRLGAHKSTNLGIYGWRIGSGTDNPKNVFVRAKLACLQIQGRAGANNRCGCSQAFWTFHKWVQFETHSSAMDMSTGWAKC